MSVETTNLGTVVSWRVGGGLRGVDPSGRFWRRGPSREPRGSSRGRRTWWFAAAVLGLGAGIALTVWLVSLLRLPRPVRIVLIGADYQDNLQIPHNAYGWAGLRQFAQLGDRRTSSLIARLCSARYHAAGAPIVLDVRARDRWGEALRNVPEPTIIVVMALHGGADRDGAYLLPHDARAVLDSPDRLRLTDVVKLFGQLPRRKKKVLVLDATGLTHHWELGMLRNGFAGELARLDEEVRKVPNLIVIGASGEGQRSWPSEAWGQSAFLHLLFESLQGETAGRATDRPWPTGSRVNLEEVCDDLSARVKSWAARHRGAVQEPMILPSGDGWRTVAQSIELPPVERPSEPAPAAAGKDGSLARDVTERWEAYRGLAISSLAPATAAPIPWRRYQQLLRRYDELLRAVGPGAVEGYGDVLAGLEAQRVEIQQHRAIRLTASRSASLTIPVAEGTPIDPADPARDVAAWFDETWWPAPEGQERKLWVDRKAQEAGNDARDLAAQVGDLLLRRAIDDPAANFDRAARVAGLLDQPPQRPAELNFLIMIRPGLPPDWKSTGHVELVRRALRIRRLAERASLGLPEKPDQPEKVLAGPLAAAWIVDRVNEGDRHRRQAEDLLMASDQREACAAAYDWAERAYTAAIRAAETVRRAVLARDRALSDLVPISEWLADWSPPPDQLEALDDLVESGEDLWTRVHALARALETPDPGAIDAGTLDAVGVEMAHAKLKGRIEDRLNLWLRDAGETSRTTRAAFELRTLADALTLPWLGKELRLSILEHGLERLRQADGEESRTGGAEPSSPMAAPGGEGDPLIDVRRRLALSILGSDEVGAQPSPGNAPSGSHAAASGRRIGERFEHRVNEIARLIGRDDASRGARWADELASVDRLARMLDSVSNDRASSLAGSTDAIRSLPLEDYLIGQARRTRADLWHDETSESVPYDRRVAGAYLDDARELDGRLRDARRESIDAIRKDLAQAEDVRVAGPDRLIITSEDRSGLLYRIEASDRPDLRAGRAAAWFEGGEGFRIDQPASPAYRRAVPLDGSTTASLEVGLGFPRIAPDAGTSPPRSPSTLFGARISAADRSARRPSSSVIRRRPGESCAPRRRRAGASSSAPTRG